MLDSEIFRMSEAMRAAEEHILEVEEKAPAVCPVCGAEKPVVYFRDMVTGLPSASVGCIVCQWCPVSEMGV